MLNKDDKEYIKNNVEDKLDDIEKKIELGVNKATTEAKKVVSDPNSKFGKKLKDIYDKQNERSDRDKYIDELITKQDRGEATLADKVELLKASLDKKFPDDFKDGMKAMTDTIKKGGTQAAQGVNHLVERAMMSNPLTAMVWQNRDILKAVGDIGLGGLKMGLGALGALGKGTAGLLKASVNLFKKKKQNKEESVSEQEETVAITGKKEESEEDIGEKSSAQKITELHDLFFNGDFFKELQKQDEPKEKEAKNRQSILSKGLAGIGKTMQVISGVIETIMAKQKLILGGLMVGAVAILALVGWLKDKFGDSLIGKAKKAVHKTVDNLLDNSELKEERQDYRDAVFAKEDQKNLTPDDLADITKNSLSKNSQISKKETIKGVFGRNKGTSFTVEKGAVYRAPFDLMVIEWIENTKNYELYNLRVNKMEKDKAVGEYTLSDVLSPIVPPGRSAKKGEIIGYVGKNGKINITGKDFDSAMADDYMGMYNTKAIETDDEKNKEVNKLKDYVKKDDIKKRREAAYLLTMNDRVAATDSIGKQYAENGKVNDFDYFASDEGLEWLRNHTNKVAKEGGLLTRDSSNPDIKSKNNVNETLDNLSETPKVKTTPLQDKPSQENKSDERTQKQRTELKEIEQKQREQEAKEENNVLTQANPQPPIIIPSADKDNSIMPAECFNDMGALIATNC